MNSQTYSHILALPGLDGGNPIGFLATLGTFRTLNRALGDFPPKLSWINNGNVWNPVLHIARDISNQELVDIIHDSLREIINHPALTYANNPSVAREKFGEMARDAVDRYLEGTDWLSHEFLCAFGSDAITNEKGEIEDTALRTMSGAGHQHFLKFMNELVKTTEPAHLEEALFGPWQYKDSGPSLRFDPFDDRRYALRWKNPSQDASTAVRGANCLAVEGIPMLPTLPADSKLETTGFSGHKSSNTFWTWPIWGLPVDLDTSRSLLANVNLQHTNPDPSVLRSRGIQAAFRSQRITIGKYRNFTPAQAV